MSSSYDGQVHGSAQPRWPRMLVRAAFVAALAPALFGCSKDGGNASLLEGITANPAGTALLDVDGVSFGSTDAKVNVQALLPLRNGCQNALGAFLLDCSRLYGSQVRTTIHDMGGPAAQGIMQTQGLRCACVIVNGETRFDLGGDVGRVLLEGPMDANDARAALQHIMLAQYGESAPVLPAVPETESKPGIPGGPATHPAAN